MGEKTKPNILLVDDRAENLLVLEGVLDGEGYNLYKANSGLEALRIVLKQAFDLILLDVQMPTMDGFEVAKLLRGKKESKDIPIIFITAISKEAKYISKGFELGAENDPPSQVYLSRCRHLQKEPPTPDWDGVWITQKK